MPTETEIRAGFDSGAGLSQQTIDTFKAQMAKYGLDAGPVLEKHGAVPAPSGNNPPPSGNEPSKHAHVGTLSPSKIPNLSLGEVERAHQSWIAAGLPERAFLDAAARDGFNLVETNEPGASDAEIEYDAAFGGAEPGRYDLDGIYTGRDFGNIAGNAAEIAALDRDMRTILSALEYPQQMAKAFVGDILDAANRGVSEPGPARQIWQGEQAAMACKACGVSRDELVKTAAHAVANVPQALRDDLHSAGILDDARVVSALFRQGERMRLRDAMRSKR
jgi:hypothetical protein